MRKLGITSKLHTIAYPYGRSPPAQVSSISLDPRNAAPGRNSRREKFHTGRSSGAERSGPAAGPAARSSRCVCCAARAAAACGISSAAQELQARSSPLSAGETLASRAHACGRPVPIRYMQRARNGGRARLARAGAAPRPRALTRGTPTSKPVPRRGLPAPAPRARAPAAPPAAMEGGSGSGSGAAVPMSDETKRRVAAAKSYIENMYKVQHQNIQERYARCGAARARERASARRPRPRQPHARARDPRRAHGPRAPSKSLVTP